MLYYGIQLFFVLEYLRPGSYVPAINVLHLNSIVPLTVLFGSLFTKRVKVSEVLGSSSARWLIFFLSLIVISVFTCDVKLYAFTKFQAVIGYVFMFFILVKEIYSVDRMKGVLQTLILVHLAAGILTPELFSGDGERHYISAGAFGDGNDFALSVNIVIPFCLFMMVESRAVTKKLLYAGIMVILILAVVATQSRGGVISLGGVGLYYWVKSDRKFLGIVGIVLVTVVILAMAPPQFFDRMASMTQTGEQMEGSAQGRLQAWGAAVRMAVDHPLLGVGAGHFPVKFGVEYRPDGVGKNALPWITAHSSYFLLLGELGLPGIIFLLMIISSNLLAGERTLRDIKKGQRDVTLENLMVALNASLIAFAIGGAFLSAAYYPHIYLLAGLSECARQLCRDLRASEVAPHSSDESVRLVYRSASV